MTLFLSLALPERKVLSGDVAEVTEGSEFVIVIDRIPQSLKRASVVELLQTFYLSRIRLRDILRYYR
jgi:hypothetical protein